MKRNRGLHFFTRFCVFIGFMIMGAVVSANETRTTQQLIRSTETGRNRYDSWVQRSRSSSQFSEYNGSSNFRGSNQGNYGYRRGLLGLRGRR